MIKPLPRVTMKPLIPKVTMKPFPPRVTMKPPTQSYDETPFWLSPRVTKPPPSKATLKPPLFLSFIYRRSPQQLAPISLESAFKSSQSSTYQFFVQRDAHLFIWRLPAGAKLRNSIRIHLSPMPLRSCGFWRHDGSCKSSLERLTLGLRTYTFTPRRLYKKEGCRTDGEAQIQKLNLTYKAALKNSVLTLRWRS
jgi:hypothetical protein